MSDSRDASSSKSPPKKRNRITTYCCVPQCNSYAGPNVSFHKFPQDVNLKKKWEAQLKMGKSAFSSVRVCSKHFSGDAYFPSSNLKKKLYPHSFPTNNLPVRSTKKKTTEGESKRIAARRSRAAKRQDRCSNRDDTVENQGCENPPNIDNQESAYANSPNIDHQRSTVVSKEEAHIFFPNASVQVCLADFRRSRSEVGRPFVDFLSEATSHEKCTNVNFLPEWTDTSRGTASPKVTLTGLLTSKEKLFTFTGLQSEEML